MIRTLRTALAVAALALTLGLFASPALARAEDPQVAHMVFFTLADRSDASAQKLIDACNTYLSGHEGTVYFSVGTPAKDLTREVNDQEFDVSLHLVFTSRAAHDAYQTHPRHLEFIEKNQDLWSRVRVFDSYLATDTSEPTSAR